MRRIQTFLAFVLPVSWVLGGFVGITQASAVSSQPKIIFGPSAGSRAGEPQQQAVTNIENEIGRRLAAVRVFKRWDTAFPTSDDLWMRDTGHTLVMSVRAKLDKDGSYLSWRAIA